MRNKYASRFLRSIGLAWMADFARFQILRLKHKKENDDFRKRFPLVSLPPDYTLYESFQMDYEKYYLGGKESAEEIIDEVKPFLTLTKVRILDWGCGPARIVRHLPSLLGNENEIYGTDYNSTTIAWCKKNIPDVTFSVNAINPPLPFQPAFFDLIYGMSIFTHLSIDNQKNWSDELYRALSPQGVVIVTTHGEAFLERLTPDEQLIFKKNELVSRTKVKEGHRMYAAFHPPDYMEKIFTSSGFHIASHMPGKKVNEHYISQDRWILKK